MRDQGGKGKMMFSLSFIALGFHKKSHPGRNQGENMRKFALPIIQNYGYYVSGILPKAYAFVIKTHRRKKSTHKNGRFDCIGSDA